MEEIVELHTDTAEYIATVFASSVVRVAQYVELNVKKFFEFQPYLCPLHLVEVLGIMDTSQSFEPRNKVMRPRNERWKRFGQGILCKFLYQSLGEFLYATRLKSRLFHLFSGHVIGLHAHRGELHLGGTVDIRMGEPVSAVINAGFSEYDVLFAHLIILIYILRALKPNKVANARTIAEVGYYALLSCTHSIFFKAQYAPFYLHKRHVTRKIGNAVNLATIHIFIRIILQQVAPSADIELLVQYRLPFRAHALKVLYVLVENVEHN